MLVYDPRGVRGGVVWWCVVCGGLISCEAMGGRWCVGAWLVGAGLVDPLPCSLWLVVRGDARQQPMRTPYSISRAKRGTEGEETRTDGTP